MSLKVEKLTIPGTNTMRGMYISYLKHTKYHMKAATWITNVHHIWRVLETWKLEHITPKQKRQYKNSGVYAADSYLGVEDWPTYRWTTIKIQSNETDARNCSV